MPNYYFQRLIGCFFILSFLFSFISFYFIIEPFDIPMVDGQKLGNIPLEKKVQKLIELEKLSGIDAIFLGASTVDFGVSAKTFSEEVSKATGKKFVAFNFGTGGGDYFIWSDFLKLIELYSKPKIYFAQGSMGGAGGLDTIPRGGLYDILRNSPVGSSLDSEILLKLMNRLWDLKVFSSLPSLRSKIIFGKYSARVATTSDLYTINEYGDSISYNYIYLNEDAKLVNRAKGIFVNGASDIIASFPFSNNTKEYDAFFKPEKLNPSLDIGYKKIIKQTKNSNVKIFITAFPIAAIESTFEENELFKQMNKRHSFYFKELSKILNVNYLNALEDLSLKPWQVQDETHYNTYAAEIIGKKLAEKFLNQSLPKEPEANADALFALEKDKNLGQWTAIIRSPSSLEKNFLVLKYLQNANTRILPSKQENVNIILRLEKNISRIFKVERLDNNTFGVKIPENLLKTNAFYAVDLASESMQSLGMPLESYHWEKK